VPYPVIVAAAGASSRCPEGKLLKAWRGRPLLAWLLETLTAPPRLGPVLVVSGHNAAPVRTLALSFPGVQVAHNPEWASGLASSLRRGEQALGPGNGFLISLADTPLYRSETIDAILPRHPGEHKQVRQPIYAGQPGHPVYIPEGMRRYWPDLRGDQGARQLFERCSSGHCQVPVDDPGVVRDFDHTSDFEEAAL
jgi:molybdenum cofactor cytidylyltransferase